MRHIFLAAAITLLLAVSVAVAVRLGWGSAETREVRGAAARSTRARDVELSLSSASGGGSQRDVISTGGPTHGLVRVHGPVGTSRSEVTGELRAAWTPTNGSTIEERLEFDAGRWSSNQEGPGERKILECRVQGLPAEILEVHRDAQDPSAPVLVDVALGPGSWVHARDAGGAEIREGLRLVDLSDPERRANRAIPGYPGASPPLRIRHEGLSSPLWIPGDPENPREWWIQADGTRWVRAPVRSDRVDRHELLLPGGADLEVRVEGAHLDPGMELRVVGAEGRGRLLAVGLPVAGSPVLFRGLPVEDVLVKLTAGTDPGSNSHASQPIRLERERLGRIELRIPPLSPLPPTGSIHCAVQLAPEYLGIEAVRDRLALELVAQGSTDELRRSGFRSLSQTFDQSTRTDAQPNLAAWSFPDVPPGDFELRLNPVALIGEVHVEPNQVTEVRLVAPPLANLWMQLVSRDSTLVAEIQHVEVRERQSGARCAVEASEAPGSWTVLAVPGEYTVHLRGAGLWTLSKQIDLEPGPNAIDVEVVRPVAVRLQLTANGEPCEVPGSWWFTVAARPLGHSGSMTARRIAGSSYGKSGGVAAADFEFDAPGRYELVLPPLEDRPSLAPRTIEVGSTLDQVVLIEIQAPR